MLYNLKNGKTIELSVEEFFRMSDTDIADLDTLDVGDHIEDPFSGSALSSDSTLFIDEEFDSLLKIPRQTRISEKEFQLQD